jgi:hypothetical protein
VRSVGLFVYPFYFWYLLWRFGIILGYIFGVEIGWYGMDGCISGLENKDGCTGWAAYACM